MPRTAVMSNHKPNRNNDLRQYTKPSAPKNSPNFSVTTSLVSRVGYVSVGLRTCVASPTPQISRLELGMARPRTCALSCSLPLLILALVSLATPASAEFTTIAGWDRQLFPSYAVATATLRTSEDAETDEHDLGDPR